MNDVIASLGLEGIKPMVGALLLPPVPLLLVILVGTRLAFRRRGLGWALVLLGCIGVWLCTTPVVGKAVQRTFQPAARALDPRVIDALSKEAREARAERRAPATAIVVVGGGRRELSPEYGVANLTPTSIERLRYGLWLGRATGLPVAYTGGVGHAAEPGAGEAAIASRIAEQEFRLPLRWAEGRSRDTTENGRYTVPRLAADGVRRVVLVTHDYHQRRAIRAFERGAQNAAVPLEIIPAPVGLLPSDAWEAGDFVPSTAGFQYSRRVLHEWWGYLLGA